MLLNEEDSHYTRDVLRLRLGEPLEIGDKASPKLFEARVGALGERVSFETVPYIPTGVFYQPTAYRKSLVDVPRGFPQFYGVRRG